MGHGLIGLDGLVSDVLVSDVLACDVLACNAWVFVVKEIRFSGFFLVRVRTLGALLISFHVACFDG